MFNTKAIQDIKSAVLGITHFVKRVTKFIGENSAKGENLNLNRKFVIVFIDF